jgi:4-diphosphocytidyl-2-C-methyl-D-erythritol kinase
MTALLPDLDEQVTVRAHGKVNLALCVGRREADGYHEIATVFHALSLHDDVTAFSDPDGGITLSVSGDGADSVPLDSSNLAWRAAELLARQAGVVADARIHISKGIPVAGGMAGGSADAAATLVACDALWDTHLTRDVMHRLAAQLGSDVPFALHGATALGLGRGDRLTSVLARGTFHWVLALADGGLSTPDVYGALDALRGDLVVPEPRVPDGVMTALSSGDVELLGSTMVNDLQAAALSLRPQLRQVLDAGHEAGALGGLVSGSGPTCAFLARDQEHALDIAVRLTSLGVCRTVRTATGPAAGTRIIGA